MIYKEHIKRLLQDVTGLKVTPFFSVGPYPAIVYKHTPVSGGLLLESQLEIRIIGKVYDDLLNIKQKVVEVLDNPDMDYKDYEGFSYHSELAGGGDLFNDTIQMWECITIFTMTWWCK